MQRGQNPLANAGHAVLACRIQGPQSQSDRRTQNQQDWAQHRQRHVRTHVNAEDCRCVFADARRRGDQEHRTTAHPGDGSADRPGIPTLGQLAKADAVQNRRSNGGGAEHEVESPVRHEGHERRRVRKVVTEFDLGNRGNRQRRGRRGTTEADREADGCRHHDAFSAGKSNQAERLFGFSASAGSARLR